MEAVVSLPTCCGLHGGHAFCGSPYSPLRLSPGDRLVDHCAFCTAYSIEQHRLVSGVIGLVAHVSSLSFALGGLVFLLLFVSAAALYSIQLAPPLRAFLCKQLRRRTADATAGALPAKRPVHLQKDPDQSR